LLFEGIGTELKSKSSNPSEKSIKLGVPLFFIIFILSTL